MEHVCKMLNYYNMEISLTYIIDPRDIIEPQNEKILYNKLFETIKMLNPTTFEHNILRVTKKTKLYYDLLNEGYDMELYFKMCSDPFGSIDFFVKNKERTKEIIENMDTFIDLKFKLIQHMKKRKTNE